MRGKWLIPVLVSSSSLGGTGCGDELSNSDSSSEAETAASDATEAGAEGAGAGSESSTASTEASSSSSTETTDSSSTDASSTDASSTDTSSADTSSTDASSAETSSSETSTSDTTGGDGDGDGDLDPPIVRFIAMGDGGEGNDTQFAVSNALEMVCADKGGCDFVLYLGDNFYDSGVDAVTDTQFTTKFEEPYENLDLPFYIALGNHDYNEGLPDWNKSSYQVEYTQYSDKWTMPSEYYHFVAPTLDSEGEPIAHFFGLDTHRIFMNHEFNEQQSWYEAAIADSTAPWKITFGHHPYISNGRHGNAGSYENVPFVPIINGEYVQEFVESSVCGATELYFSGHDHNRQAFSPVCGTRFIVTGAAAKTTDFEHYENNPTLWEDDQWAGFMVVELSATGGTLEAWGVNDADLDDYQLQYSLDLGAP